MSSVIESSAKKFIEIKKKNNSTIRVKILWLTFTRLIIILWAVTANSWWYYIWQCSSKDKNTLIHDKREKTTIIHDLKINAMKNCPMWHRIIFIRILQVMMLRVKFGRIKISTNLLQRVDKIFGHFNNKFCHKVNKKRYDFSNEIADCCSIWLATLPQKNCKFWSKIFSKNFHKEIWYSG